MSATGEYRNPHLNQLLLFKGLEIGNIYPTDIDFFLDWKDRLFIFGEVKYGNAALGTGQRLGYERLVNASCVPGGRQSIAYHIRHWQKKGDILIANCQVVSYYFRGDWHKVTQELTLADAYTSVIAQLGDP